MSDSEIRQETARWLANRLGELSTLKKSGRLARGVAAEQAVQAVAEARKRLRGQQRLKHCYATALDRLERVCRNGWVAEASEYVGHPDFFGSLLRGERY